MRKIRKNVAKLMIAVIISTLLSTTFSAVAYAEEIAGLTEESNVPAEDMGSTDLEDGSETVPGTEEDSELVEGDEDSEDEMNSEDVEEESENESEEESDAENSEDVSETEESENDSEDENSEEASDETSEDASEEETSEDITDKDSKDAKKGTEGQYDAQETQVKTLILSGWVEEDGGWKYIKRNGRPYTNCVKKLGGYYYGFNSEGFRIDNTEFQMGDKYYKAKEDGKLYTNEWFISDYWRFYYGSDAARYQDGAYEIDGQLYCFSWGYLIYGYDQAYSVDGKNYFIDADGKAQEVTGNGWKEFNGKRYYVSNGEFLRNRMKAISGVRYYFNYEGVMLDDGITTDYSSQIPAIYGAKKGGALYTSEWNPNKDYYFGSDSKAYRNGILKVDGKDHYFDYYGFHSRNEVFEYNGKTYYSSASGVVREVKNNSWIEDGDGYRYYFMNGALLKNCVQYVDNAWYGFDYYGRMYKDRDFYIIATDNSYDYYNASENGALTCNAWAESHDRFYGWNGKAYDDGLHTIDDTMYVFSRGGILIKNDVGRYGENNQWLLMDDNGKGYYLLQIRDNYGWCDTETGRYNAINTGTTASSYELLRCGVHSVANVDYLFDNTGILLINGIYEDYTGTVYLSDDEGRAFEAKDGWKEIGDDTYYVENGSLIRNQIKKIDGNYYGFHITGKLMKNRSFSKETLFNSTNSFDPYQAKEDGVLYRKEWYKNNYYFGNDCIKVRGWNIIEKKTYFMDDTGKKQTGFKTIDGKRYYFNTNGVLQINKWVKLTKIVGKETVKQVYHTDKYGIVMTGLKNIDGDYYYFNSKGLMATETWVKIGSKYYYAGKNGKIKRNCWISVGGKRYHVNAKGVRQTGWLKDGDKYYYLNENGEMVTGTVRIGKKTYKFNSKGVCKNR